MGTPYFVIQNTGEAIYEKTDISDVGGGHLDRLRSDSNHHKQGAIHAE
jgi:hypothetical protein